MAAFCTTAMMADSKQTITVNGYVMNCQATRITFNGDYVFLTLDDGSIDSESLADVNIAFDYVAVFKDNGYDNIATIKTFSGKPTTAEVTRTLTANQWAPICLPFGMKAADIAAAFGEGTRVATLESTEERTVNFQSVEEITASMPYIICPTKDVSSFSLENAEIANVAGGSTVSTDKFDFTGTLTEQTPGEGTYYFATGNKLKKLTSGSILPLRAFLFTSSSASATTFTIDGELTGILSVLTGEPAAASVYTLSGQYVGDKLSGLPKGIYLSNGKKVIVK